MSTRQISRNLNDVRNSDPRQKKKKSKSFFGAKMNKTLSRWVLSKPNSSKNMTGDKSSYVESGSPKEARTSKKSKPSLRRKTNKKSVSRKPKINVNYEGDKVVNKNNANVEEQMKTLLRAKARRREEIFDASDDEDGDSIKSDSTKSRSRRTTDQFATELSNMNTSVHSGGKRAKRSMLNLTLKRKGKKSLSEKLRKPDRAKVFRIIPKTPEEHKILSKALLDNIFFSALDHEELDLIVSVLQQTELEAGESLVESRKNIHFFIVKKGTLQVLDAKAQEEAELIKEGKSYGELSLIRDTNQDLTISALEKTEIYTLNRKTYRKVIAYSEEERMGSILQVLFAVPLLQSLSREELENIADCVQLVRFKTGDAIIVKGQVGSVFYMIKSGSVQCTKVGKEGDDLMDITLSVNDYFGERALLVNEPRAANVVALENVECLALDKDSFTKHLGSLNDIMTKNLSMRVLKSVPLLHELADKKLLRLVDAMEKESFLPGHMILEQGVTNKKLYIILEGEVEVKVFDQSDRQKHTVVATLKKGNFFGESAFKSNSVTNAEVGSIGHVVCQTLQVRKHLRLIKPIAQTIKRHNNQRKQNALEAVQKTSIRIENKEQLIPLEDLEHIKTLGTGTFGRVKLVEHTRSGDTYALKILQKAFVVQFKQQKNVLHEKNVMMKSQHPFILKLHKTFVDRNCLYFLLEYVQGGELFSLLQSSGGYLKPHYAKFYAACVVDGIGYLHKRKVVYRDLKPENLMIDSEGYIRIVDFGFAKKVDKKTFTLCGTPEYLAPEVVKHSGHNRAVDYWAIGVLIYEMICGFSPFSDPDDDSQEGIFKRILKGNFAFPKSFPRHARLLVRRLMEMNPQDRIGMFKDGPDELKAQRWFMDIDFEQLLEKQVSTPWVPTIKDPKDTRNFDHFDEDDSEMPYRGSNKYWQNF